jgi:hypothetical protein
MATTTSIAATELYPLGGITNSGAKLGFVTSGAKAAQNDLWKITNAKTVLQAWITVDATGVAEAHTISGNDITLTSATATACSGLILYL